jgi:hypothetical protein
MAYSQGCFNSVPCNHWCCEKHQLFSYLFVSSIFVDNCLHESSNNCQRPTRICNSVYVGRRRIYANPDCFPTLVWKSLWSSGTKGLLLLTLIRRKSHSVCYW